LVEEEEEEPTQQGVDFSTLQSYLAAEAILFRLQRLEWCVPGLTGVLEEIYKDSPYPI
jgi:hypothetical protein